MEAEKYFNITGEVYDISNVPHRVVHNKIWVRSGDVKFKGE